MDHLPTSGEDYLRMVKAQARSCPNVVVSDAAKAHLSVKNTSRKYKTDWQSCLPAPEGCAPSIEWRQQFMIEFNEARAQLIRYKTSQQGRRKQEKQRSIPPRPLNASLNVNPGGDAQGQDIGHDSGVVPTEKDPLSGPNAAFLPLPKIKDEQLWRELLYGPPPPASLAKNVANAEAEPISAPASASSSVLSTPPSSTISNIPTKPTHAATSDALSGTAFAPLKEEAEGRDKPPPEPENTGMAPLPQFLIRLDQGYLIQLLRYHLRWMAEDCVTDQQGKWLYALFLKLDPLVESDQVAILRNLAKKCARIRSHLNNESGSQLATVNMVITIVGQLFGQEDLE